MRARPAARQVDGRQGRRGLLPAKRGQGPSALQGSACRRPWRPLLRSGAVSGACSVEGGAPTAEAGRAARSRSHSAGRIAHTATKQPQDCLTAHGGSRRAIEFGYRRLARWVLGHLLSCFDFLLIANIETDQRKKEFQMAKVVSFINLKGGVAKTTTTIQIAECLTQRHGKNVLVVDLDPQTNATAALIGNKRWIEVDKTGQTIHQLFSDLLDRTEIFDISRAIINCEETRDGRLSLLPSSVRMLDIQDRLQDIASKTHNTIFPETAIKTQLHPVLTNYDYVLFDCPPNLGNLTKNGIEMSDWYIIPTVPDYLSTKGVPQIINKIEEIKKIRSLKINCCGLVFTKYISRSSIHQEVVRDFPETFGALFEAKGCYPGVVFKTTMPQANQWSDAVEYIEDDQRNLEAKWGRSTSGSAPLYQHIESLTEEFIKNVK